MHTPDFGQSVFFLEQEEVKFTRKNRLRLRPLETERLNDEKKSANVRSDTGGGHGKRGSICERT
jgi:hypothetical protein